MTHSTTVGNRGLRWEYLFRGASRTDPNVFDSSIRLLPGVFDGEPTFGMGMKDARRWQTRRRESRLLVPDQI